MERFGLTLASQRPRAARARLVLGAVNWGILLIVVILAVVKVQQPLSDPFNEQLESESLPAGAVEWIEMNHPEGKMFNHYNWGGYLIHRLWPDYQVFVDGRTDLYGDEILTDYVEIQRSGPDALSLLNEYDVSFVLTQTGDSLSSLLDCRDDWQMSYEDQIATIWVRRPE